MRYVLTAVIVALAVLATGESMVYAVNNSPFNQLVNTNSWKCLDVEGASVQPGAKIVQYTCHGGGNETWAAEYAGVEYGITWVYLRNQLSGLCLDVTGRSTTQGTQLQQFTCNGDLAQRFTVAEIDGTARIRARISWQCVEILGKSTANMAKVVQWPCYTTYYEPNQNWWARQAFTVWNYLYEPTGWDYDRPSLNCGYHELCAPRQHTNGEKHLAIDWDSESVIQASVYTRLRTEDSLGGNSPTGRMEIRDGQGLACNGVTTTFFDLWGNATGRQVFFHTDFDSSQTIQLYANGVFSPRVGYYEYPDEQGCPTDGPHTHVFYENYRAYLVTNNSALPNEGEETCGDCLGPIWSRWQKRFTLNR